MGRRAGTGPLLSDENHAVQLDSLVHRHRNCAKLPRPSSILQSQEQRWDKVFDQVTRAVAARPVHLRSDRCWSAEGSCLVSPNQAAFLVPTLVFCIYFAAFYVNIKLAKKRVSIWKRRSTYMFLRTIGLAGVKTKAKLVWMKELGYDEHEAIILAGYQSRAIFSAFICFFIFVPIAVSLVQH